MQTWGFTRNELRVLLILALTFLAGLAVQWYTSAGGVPAGPANGFDYTESDRQFGERSKRLAELSLPPPAKQAQVRRTTAPPPLPKPLSINVNTATKAELMSLPGIGETYAERILLHREDIGPFASVDDLLKIKGIGKKRLEAIRPYLTLN
jgi:competence protein ComEA